MSEQRAWIVSDERREDAVEAAKAKAREEGWKVRTLVRVDLVGGCWRITLAVVPAVPA